VFTNANVPSVVRLGSFPVNTMGLPTGFTQNPTYAQPLYVPNLSIAGGTHNVAFIATLNGEVYAYDADNTSTPTKLWYRDETNAAGMKGLKHDCDVGLTLGSSVPKNGSGPQQLGYLDFAGVVSTPVIDAAPVSPNPAALYVVNLCQNANGLQHWYTNSLNLTTGQTLGPTPPLEIVYSTTDITMSPYGPQQLFAAASQLERPGLLLTYSTTTYQRSVIAGFGTSVHEMTTQYQGWVFAFDVENPSSVVNQAYAEPYITQCYFNETTSSSQPPCTSNPNGAYNANLANPCGQGGGVWMSARGPASNSKKEVFFVSGNGGFQYCPSCAHHCAGNPTTSVQEFTDFGEAVMGVNMPNVWSTTSGQAPFWPIDYFVPDAVPPPVGSGQGYFEYLNANDWDMGVTGTLLFDDNWYDSLNKYDCPQQICSGVSMLVAASKRGDGYVLLQGSLGQSEAGDTGEVNNFMLTTSNPTCTTMEGGGPQCDEPRTPALWQQASNPSVLVAWPWFEDLASFQWKQSGGTTSQFNFASVSTSNSPFSKGNAGYPGGTLALSFNRADASGNAVVWAVATPPDISCSGTVCNPGYLLAYSLTPAGVLSSNPVWPSLPLPSSADFVAAPYAIPTVVNGRVYVPTYGLSDGTGGYTKSGIEVYGLP